MHFQAQLFIQPGFVNHLGRLHRQFLQQRLVFRVKGLGPVGIHVDHPADFPVHIQRHGQFGFDAAPHGHITRILRDIAHTGGAARARHPAGDALAHLQFQALGRRGQVLGG